MHRLDNSIPNPEISISGGLVPNREISGTHFQKLEDLSQKSEIFFPIKKIISSLFPLFIMQRTAQALRTQEHLIRQGSGLESQIPAFLQIINEQSGENFTRLAGELRNIKFQPSSSPSAPVERLTPFFTRQDWLNNVKNSINSLKNGESTWIRLHAEDMRLRMVC